MRNKARGVELWFGDFREAHYQASPGMKEYIPESRSLEARRKLHETLQCRAFGWFVERFRPIFVDKQMLALETFLVGRQTGDSLASKPTECITAAEDSHLRLAPCNEEDVRQRFAQHFGNSALRSMHTRSCLDAISAQVEGTEPILFICMQGNQNQEWQIIDGRLRWGSFCLEEGRGNPGMGLALYECWGGREAQPGSRDPVLRLQVFGHRTEHVSAPKPNA